MISPVQQQKQKEQQDSQAERQCICEHFERNHRIEDKYLTRDKGIQDLDKILLNTE
jgi:hypothetical protein